jgi:hypothetical protein
LSHTHTLQRSPPTRSAGPPAALQLHERFDPAGPPILIDIDPQELAAEQRSGQQPQPSDSDSCLDETILQIQ